MDLEVYSDTQFPVGSQQSLVILNFWHSILRGSENLNKEKAYMVYIILI